MATAASEDVKFDTDIFKCSICLERFTKPKYLPCLHTFCESCLNTYIATTKSGKDNLDEFSSFPCPVCRQEVQLHDPKIPMEDWAKLMPLNHMIYSLMESSDTLKNKGETKCKQCERNYENTLANFWCFQCIEGMCETCKKYHKVNKVSTTHKVIPICELENSDVVLQVFDIDEPCPVHEGEILKVYCINHKEMCCVLCLSIDHRKCEDIKTFGQMANSMRIEKEREQLTYLLKRVCSNIKSLEARKQKNIDIIQTQQQGIFDEVSGLVEQAKKNLDKCHEDFKTWFSRIHKDQISKLEDANERMENFRKTILNCEKVLNAVFQHGSPKQIFITIEKVMKQLRIQSQAAAEFLKDDCDIEYSFAVDENIAGMTTLTSLASLQVETMPYDVLSFSYICTLEHSPDNEDTELLQRLKAAVVKVGKQLNSLK